MTASPREEAMYKAPRWKHPVHGVRIRVLRRDGYRCWAKQETANGLIPCPTRATVADHINPVYEGMPEFEFYSMSNLRASCRRHNTARGVAARLDRETMVGDAVAATIREQRIGFDTVRGPVMQRPPRLFSYGGRRPNGRTFGC